MALLVIQEICTEWTKASRGAPRATLRNAVPENVVLSDASRGNCGSAGLYHRLCYGEWNDFSSPVESLANVELGEEMLFGCVRIYPLEDPPRVVFAYDMAHGGAPERESRLETAFELQRNAWGRVVYNGRFSEGYESVWTYRKTVCNIGLFDCYNAKVLVDSGPACVYKSLARLR